MTFRPVLPAPLEKYDRRNEAETRSAIEQQFAQLPGHATGGLKPGADIDGYYIVDRADHAPRHAAVVHRALGPDRVPASPSSMDDEFLNATTGYDPAKWTLFSHGSETYGFDALGGLVIHTANDSKIVGIQQAMDPSQNWAYTAKVCVGVPRGAGNSHVGILVHDSVNDHFCFFAVGYASGVLQLNVFTFNDPSTFTATVEGTGSNYQAAATEWVYLRMRGNNTSNPVCEYSFNGVAWRVLGGINFANNADRIGIGTFQGDSNVGPMYVQWFRRTT